MDELIAQIRAVLPDSDAWVVGGAVRDELLGREMVDIDVACASPRDAARAFARRGEGDAAPFPLSERHGAWRVVLSDGRTLDFTPLPDGIEQDLATRDFTINAMARPLEGAEIRDPFGGRRDLESRVIRSVSPGVFEADPLRLLRAVRLEDELGFRCDPETEGLVVQHAELVSQPAGERILGELERLSVDGYRRLAELGLLDPLGGSVGGLDRAALVDSPDFRLVCVFGERLERLPVSRRVQRYARTLLRAQPPPDASARSIHRFRRATEPWALDALAFVAAPELTDAVLEARAGDPAEPLLRGNELGLPAGPDIGRLLEEIAEERAAGTITTREEALDLVRRRTR